MSEKEAYWLKDHISSFLNDRVFPRLEQLFDDMDAGESISRFERINLDISLDNWNRPDDLQIEIENQLRQKMAIEAIEKRYPVNGEKNQSNGIAEYHQVDKISGEQNQQSIFLFFLTNGYLPWYGHKSDIDQLLSDKEWKKSIETERFATEVKQLLNSDEEALERFILQLPQRNIMQFINVLETVDQAAMAERNTFIESLDRDLWNKLIPVLLKIGLQQPAAKWKADLLHFYAIFLKDNSSEKPIQGQIHQFEKRLKDISQHTSLVLSQQDCDKVWVLLKEQKQNKPLKKGVTNQKRGNIEDSPAIISHRDNYFEEKEPLFFEKEAGDIAVQNAGQVLFHPFLKLFFQQFNWLDEDGRIKDNYRFQAVQALHYCATGNEQFFEGDLVLEKFLCGVPLKKTVPVKSLLNETIKEEANNMLRELIENWPALKNTSPDGLREMFVKRSGKLIQKDRNYKLIVERKTQDILLEKLQWNISIIKLPWKKELIFVEW